MDQWLAAFRRREYDKDKAFRAAIRSTQAMDRWASMEFRTLKPLPLNADPHPAPRFTTKEEVECLY